MSQIEFTYRCPNCGQLMPIIRYGIRFSARRAAIIDCIKNDPGVTGHELAERLGGADATIKQLIWQINNTLMETDFRILGFSGHGYHIIRRDEEILTRTKLNVNPRRRLKQKLENKVGS